MQQNIIQQEIDKIVKENPVVLFMKGTKQFPQCGFSSRAVEILYTCGYKDFYTVNVLENNQIREEIKVYSDWPTIPQLYINGKFIGGSDIMMEMYQENELQDLLQNV